MPKALANASLVGLEETRKLPKDEELATNLDQIDEEKELQEPDEAEREFIREVLQSLNDPDNLQQEDQYWSKRVLNLELVIQAGRTKQPGPSF
jgi:hypothetical protein